jgi:nitrogen-specific signal transduction histidine kinase/CheY-like chemotaxis protein
VIVAGAIPYLFSRFHAKHRVEEHERLQVVERSRRLQSVGALAAGVAHEFNNLLTVVAGNASMLASSGSRSDEEAEDLRAIVEAAEIGAKLTRDLLALSRADDGEARCQLPEALTSALRLMAPTLGPGIAVVLDIEEPLPLVAIGRQQVEQIFINLALNGKQAMNGAGTLSIEVTAVDEAAAITEGLEPGVWVRAAISDDGCGMSAEVQERIFDPFYTSSEVGGGTGLGLSIIFGMVSRVGGTIRVASEVGAGTRFDIFLPAGDLPSPASEPEPEPTLAPAQPRLLLVEDDQMVRRLARRVLDGAGYQVLEAEDGRAALDLLERGDTFDLIVTDVRMPRLSGTQLATEARAAGVRAPFLFISGHLDESMATHIRAELDSRLVSKPFTPAALVDAVRQELAQRRADERAWPAATSAALAEIAAGPRPGR